jgi:hypothetical protein
MKFDGTMEVPTLVFERNVIEFNLRGEEHSRQLPTGSHLTFFEK